MNYDKKFSDSLYSGRNGEKIISEWFVNTFTDKNRMYSLVDNSYHKGYDLMFNEYPMRDNGRYDIFPSRKIAMEVKTDFYPRRTNNMFIETSSRGKKSGINSSESDIYVYYFTNQELYPEDNILMIKTKTLRELIKSYRNNIVSGGDNNTSFGVLLPYEETKSFFRTYTHHDVDVVNPTFHGNSKIVYIGDNPNKYPNPFL